MINNLQKKAIAKLNSKDKKRFIELYCNQTGFPDMQKTSDLIEKDMTQAIINASKETGVEIIFAGYNPTCSVGNGHALPGSDFDTLFIWLKDWENFDAFKNKFKKNVNPLLCAVTRTRTNDVPDYVVINDLIDSTNLAQRVFEDNSLYKKSAIYEATLDEQISDWTKAGEYNLDVNTYIPDADKTPLLRAGLVLEILRDGNVIIDELDSSTKEFFENSCVYKYTNMQQMRSYKNAPLKAKHRNREAILSRFNKLSDDEKLNMIFNVVNLSVKDLKSQVDEKYLPMFKDSGCGNMEDLMQPLLSNNHRLPEYRDK